MSASPNEAESLGVQQLVSAFGPVFPNFRVLRNLVIPMPEGSPVRTAEFDAVVVCESGVYLFEIKGWRNAYVYREKTDDAPSRWFLRSQGCAVATEVMDPAAQGGRKTTFLRKLLPERMKLHYYVLLPCDGVELEGRMPAAIITSSDLPYVARLIRSSVRTSRASTPLDAEAIELTVQMLFSLQGDLTLDEHIRNCQARADRMPRAQAVVDDLSVMDPMGCVTGPAPLREI
jgi:hypothetical protein